MSSIQAVPGFYGKLPILGDFVFRRLPSSFVRAWDAWLQDSLATSKEQLGSGWLDIYLTSPIWRFGLSAGTCGTSPCAGILMPSVDNVGRYFPLTVAALIPERNLLPWLFFAGAEWFTKLERVALSVLEDELDFDAFDRELQKQFLEPFLPQAESGSEACELNENNSHMIFQIGMNNLAELRESFVHLSACLLDRFLPGYSLWCTSGSEKVKPTLLGYHGLPPSGVFAELLAGQAPQADRNRRPVASLPLPTSDQDVDLADRDPDRTAAVAAMRWRSAARSTVGKVRKVNEDAYLDRPEIQMWAVADGMGGHEAGDVASRTVVTALSNVPGNDSLESLIRDVTTCLQEVNSDLLGIARGFGRGHIVGSTVVVMVADENRCAALWVGDSRLYRCRDGCLEQITRDHSLVAELSRSNVGPQSELANDAVSSVLTRALGAEANLEIDTIMYEARKGDAFLLCTDGLFRETDSGEIAEILSKNDCEGSAQELIDLSLARGARDNVTVVVVCPG
jgi:type VI secretion system protein ImpM